MECIGKVLKEHAETAYGIIRAIIGLLFMQHGLMKLGMLSGAAQETFSLMWTVGVFEVLVGVFLVLGLFVRAGAIIGIVIMISAYYRAHMPQALHPLDNGGQLALVFLFIFVYFLFKGAGKLSLEKKYFKKECF